MSMLTLQVLALLLLFGLIGAFLGWLIRPFFCKPGTMGGRGKLSGSAGANANAKMGTGKASVNTAKGATAQGKASGNNKGSGGKTAAAAAGIAAAAATAAAVSASNKKDNDAKAKAGNAAKQAEASRKADKAKAAEQQRVAAEKAKAAKLAEQQRLAAEKAKAAKQAEEQRLAAEKAKAAKLAEEQRLAAEKAKAAKLAEEQRIAAEKAKAAKLAEEQRLAAEKAKAAKLAEEQRLAAEKANQSARAAAIEADKKQLAAEAEAARRAEADRLAAEKAKADQDAKDAAAKAEADRIAAEQKAKADQAAKDAAAKAENDRVAAEKAKAEQAAKDAADKAEADRIAADKAKAEQAAKDAAAKAEADRIAAEKAKAEQAAKDAAAKAEADRIAAEKAKAEQAAKDAAAKAEADRIAAEKAKAEQAAKDAAAKAEADRIAAEKAKADQAAKDAAAKVEADRVAAEQKAKADQAAKESAARADQAAKDAAAKAQADKAAADKANAAKLAAVAAAAAATTAVAASDSDDDEYANVTDDMRPQRLSAPRGGSADDLKRIKGIGPVIEGTLNEEGVYHFQQIADFTPDNVKWVDKNVSIPGRVHRDDWIGQAQSLIDGREYDGYAKDIAGTEDPSLPPVTEDMRPAKLAGPTGGKADDLKRINGIGPVIEKTLNAEGIYHFHQIAHFTPDNVNWVDRHISFPGRITREEWIRQAKGLAAEGGAGSAEDVVITEDMRPARRTLSAGDKADDLKVINGIGPVIEKSLNEEGVYFYQQIADFDEDNTKWVDNHMAFPGRIHREEWIPQAKALVGQKGAGTGGSGDSAAAITVTEDMRPTRRKLGSGEKADDLKVINGIGPVIEDKLNEEGVYFYQQIADFDEDNTKWVDNHMAFPGRIHREEWIPQAKALVGQQGAGADAEITVTEDMRPTRRTLGPGEKADDLKVINGIGPVIEDKLNAEGIYFYQQVADFNEDNTKWVDNHMAFPGRIHREDWIGQAKVLVGQKGSASSGSGSTSGAAAKPAASAVGSALGSSGAVPESMKPTLLSSPEGGKADDLKRIKGIGKVLERNLHEMGIYHYEQLAALTPDNIKWLTDYVSFPDGRIDDEKWTSQAKALAEGKQTEYSQRFDKGDTPYK